jgi:hypothetical protein
MAENDMSDEMIREEIEWCIGERQTGGSYHRALVNLAAARRERDELAREVESAHKRLRALVVDAGDAPLTDDPIADIEAVLASKDRELCGLAMLHAHQAEADALNYERHDAARESAERERDDAITECRRRKGWDQDIAYWRQLAVALAREVTVNWTISPEISRPTSTAAELCNEVNASNRGWQNECI